ncbi:MAG: hypothetical protein SGPRY_003889, partial [Prymnesium sp.]
MCPASPPPRRCKVMFRQLRAVRTAHTPVLVQINYHADVAPRMKAVLARFHQGNPTPFTSLPLADGATDTILGCDPSSQRVANRNGGSLPSRLEEESPFAWAGTGDVVFLPDGELSTPWGKGSWGAHPDDPTTSVFADFVG